MATRIVTAFLGLVLAFCSVSSASGELLVRGTGTIPGGGGIEYSLIYDSTLDITWLDFSHNGTWQAQLAWAEALEVNFGELTLTDWRVAGIDELTALYSDPEKSTFTDLVHPWYWSGTEYTPNPIFAWIYHFGLGIRSNHYKTESHYAFAVIPGDVGDNTAEPVPALGLVGLLLTMAGLAILGLMKNKFG